MQSITNENCVDFLSDEDLVRDSYQHYYNQYNLLPGLDISLDNSDPGYTVITFRRTTRLPPCARRSSADSALFPPGVNLGHLGD